MRAINAAFMPFAKLHRTAETVAMLARSRMIKSIIVERNRRNDRYKVRRCS